MRISLTRTALLGIALGLLSFSLWTRADRVSKCRTQFGGVCMEPEDNCRPLTNATARQDISLCAPPYTTCCIPPEKLVQPRRDDKCGLSRPKGNSVCRIAGADRSLVGEWPWFAYLLTTFRNKSHSELHRFCGSSLIHPKWVVTAAHCVNKPLLDLIVEKSTVRIGEITVYNDKAPRRVIPLKNVYVHPLYREEKEGLIFDMALLELQHPVELDDNVDTICLPNKDENFDNMVCTVAGFGVTEYGSISNSLRQLDQPIYPLEDCSKFYNREMSKVNMSIMREHICAGFMTTERTACFGDSGGPLMCKNKGDKQWVLAGVVSFGPADCKDVVHLNKSPTVFTRVSSFLEWIESVTKLPVFDGSYSGNPNKIFQPSLGTPVMITV